jgi:regulator of protease activity HflC (stomatin/prohibitin superfamily)
MPAIRSRDRTHTHVQKFPEIGIRPSGWDSRPACRHCPFALSRARAALRKQLQHLLGASNVAHRRSSARRHLGLAFAYSIVSVSNHRESLAIVVVSAIIAFIVSYSVKVADQWERVVVLRLGRFRALEGPGVFFLLPVIEAVAYWIDTRVITCTFKAEKTLTKDTVPVDVDAVLFWKVVDPKKAALDVSDHVSAINWASQTALRDVIGKTLLADMLDGREKISDELQRIIDVRTEPWGIDVISVEVKDVLIPPALEDAMSMQAQAERARQARVSSAIQSARSRKNSVRRRRPTPIIRPRFICGR